MKLPTLHVCMFGTFTLTYADRQISCSGNRSKLIWNILAYLLYHRGKAISSDDLISVIWKPEKIGNPAGAMRTAIHRLRQLLGELTPDDDFPFLLSKDGGYLWNPDVEIILDTDLFEARVNALKHDSDLDKVEGCLSVLELYTGKFLPAQSAEMWVIPLQTYYHNLYEEVIEQVVPLLEDTGRLQEAADICRKALQIAPYSERVYQLLMEILLKQENRQEVITVYEDLSKMLLSTFNVLPNAESRALYREAQSTTQNETTLSPDALMEQLPEQGEINGAIVCDYDSFQMLYRAQARAIVRSGMVIHTALVTLTPRSNKNLSQKSLNLAMDHLEEIMSGSLRRGDAITRCSTSQFIVMLPNANYEDSCRVCQRLISSFERQYPHAPVQVDYFVQPIIPSTKS